MTHRDREPGLVLIQIDGLSRSELEAAVAAGRMPRMTHLMTHEGYRLHTMYSGMPSTTPAVQAELFYGRRGVVPAFGFRDAATREPVTMLQPHAAAAIESELERSGTPLLAGGAAYSDIFSGGAAEAHFCPGRMSVLPSWEHVTGPGVLAMHLWRLVLAALLMVLELLFGARDMIAGLVSGEDAEKEIEFVPARLAVCVLLRELVSIGAAIDIARGLPVIHLNLIGYDEQAHRRGPGSEFARGALAGIDRAISRLCKAAHRSKRRAYQVWIYSDHGQERTEGYERERGEPLAAAVERVVRAHGAGEPLVIAKGPVGHVYVDPATDLPPIAHDLARTAGVPIVLVAAGPDKAIAWTARGRFPLPDQADRVLGPDHPFLDECARDLVALVHNRHAGQLVLCGMRESPPHLTFPSEHGSHAGPGAEETRAFALLPADARVRPDARYLRPSDLREAALARLGRR